MPSSSLSLIQHDTHNSWSSGQSAELLGESGDMHSSTGGQHAHDPSFTLFDCLRRYSRGQFPSGVWSQGWPPKFGFSLHTPREREAHREPMVVLAKSNNLLVWLGLISLNARSRHSAALRFMPHERPWQTYCRPRPPGSIKRYVSSTMRESSFGFVLLSGSAARAAATSTWPPAALRWRWQLCREACMVSTPSPIFAWPHMVSARMST